MYIFQLLFQVSCLFKDIILKYDVNVSKNKLRITKLQNLTGIKIEQDL